MARLIHVRNSFAGVTPFDDLKPVKKFQTREIAVNRIWAAITRLATVPETEAPPKSEPTATSRGKKKSAKPPKKAVNKKRAPRAASAKPGLNFEREYKSKKYVLRSVEQDGKIVFKVRGGETYNSLTAAAKAITEYPAVSGPAFWGEGTKATGAGE